MAEILVSWFTIARSKLIGKHLLEKNTQEKYGGMRRNTEEYGGIQGNTEEYRGIQGNTEECGGIRRRLILSRIIIIETKHSSKLLSLIIGQYPLTVPTLLLAPTKYVFAMAALRASIGHIGSLYNLAMKGLICTYTQVPECSYSGRGVKHYLSSIETICTPV